MGPPPKRIFSFFINQKKSSNLRYILYILKQKNEKHSFLKLISHGKLKYQYLIT